MTEEATLDFVSKSFHSIWPIELLFTLCQDPGRTWHVDELTRELRASVLIVTKGINVLETLGFVVTDQRQACRLDTKSTELAALAHAVTDLYDRKPRAINRAIFSASKDRMQTFAEAFRLRKDIC